MQGRQELTNRRIGRATASRLTGLAPQSTSAAAPVLQTHRSEDQGTCTTGRHRPRTACTSGRGTNIGTDGRHEVLREPGRRQVGGRRDGPEWWRRKYRDWERDECELSERPDVLSIAVPRHAGRNGGPDARWSAAANPCRTVETDRPASHGHASERVSGEVVRLQPVAVATSSFREWAKVIGGLQSPQAGQLFPGWFDHRPQTVPSPRGLRGRRSDPLGLSSRAVRPPEREAI